MGILSTSQENEISTFHFLGKHDRSNTVMISTHGIEKKTDKIPKKEIEKTQRIMTQYFESKK